MIVGSLICIVRVGKKNVLYYLVSVFVSFFRGTPALIQIYLILYGLPKLLLLFQIDINRWSALTFFIIATVCNFSSFVAETFRGAYLAMNIGQIEAGYSVGYSRWQCLYKIIVPQTLQIALPNLKNLEIDLLKGTALAYIIGVVDVMGFANALSATHMGYGRLWILLMAAIIYFAINVLIEVFFRLLTAYYSKHERGLA
jgi:L-cystine transport system permease protein